MFKVCLAGSNVPLDGTTTFATIEDAWEYLRPIQVYYDENDPERPLNNGSKYVVLPHDMV